MKFRSQRTHFMGYSNRCKASDTKNKTTDVFQKSFNKSKSQYNQAHNDRLNGGSQAQIDKHGIAKLSELNFNSVYKDSQKGHHYEFQTKKLQKRRKKQFKNNHSQVQTAPLLINFNHKPNSYIVNIKNEFKDKQISLHKLNQLKYAFLRNNQKRRNLKDFFQLFANQNGLLQKQGLKKLIKHYGYDANQHQISLIFRLNKIHQVKNPCEQISADSIDLPQFIDLMTKQNVYFKTLKLSDGNPGQNISFRFSSADFQIFRNQFFRLKEALNVYKDETIDVSKFQKIMKKLDVNDLIIAEDKRLQVFRQFSNQKGELNIQRMLSCIATQQHQRIKKSGNQLKVNNYDHFQGNLDLNKQLQFEKELNDPLNQLLYPYNLKRASITDYERRLAEALNICSKLKQLKQQRSKDIIDKLCESKSSIKRPELYKRVENVLQSQGYNFSGDQYKSFMAYLDFDPSNRITKQNLEKFILKQDKRQRVDRLDRRKRNYQKEQSNQQNHLVSSLQDQDYFVQKMRSRSSCNWATAKRSVVKQQNLPQFKVPTKFSAWPQRLYNTDFTLVQAQNQTGMGLPETKRFQKDGKHSLGLQDKSRKMRIYENKVRKITQWQDLNQKKVQEQSKIHEKRDLARHYNLRLLKEQYESRCHASSMIQ